MNKNKEILEHCPNFYKIVNFEYYEDDLFSLNLVSMYEDYIFTIDHSDLEQLSKVTELDLVLSKYIDDYNFRKEIKNELMQIKVQKDEKNIIEVLIYSIISFFNRYQEGQTIPIYISQWI